jgi:hypothetical protein
MPPEPPQNAGYMIAAYVVTAVIVLGYLLALWRRTARALDLSAHPHGGTPDTR